MVEAAVPTLIYDPGIGDTDLMEDVLAVVGEKFGKVKSITDGVLVVGSNKVKLDKVLFDTGALHRSYISKELVDYYRTSWESHIVLAESIIRLADQKTVLGSKEELMAKVIIKGEDDKQYTADIDFVVWSMPGMDMIIGLPDITNHFKEKLIQMLSNV